MRKILSILLALSLALSLSVPALAASGDVAYLAYNAATGEFDPQTKAAGEYTVVTGSTTAWSAGWYVVSEDVTITDRITVTGDVHLILADGKTLKAEKGITVNSGDSLTIYGQTTGTGTLTTGTADQYYAGIGGGGRGKSSGPITINGGTVTATGGSYAAGIGGSNGGTGTVTIHGGTVTAKGGSYGAGIGGGENGSVTVTINGGTVTATGGYGGAGIGTGHVVDDSVTVTITISGGTVTAKSGTMGAGIGTGYVSNIASFTNTVTIPASVTLGGTATVKAEGVRVDYGKQVVVRLDSGNALTVALEGDPSETLAYTVSAGGQEIAKGGAVLAVNPANATGNTLASGTATLSFALADTAVVKYSGSYTGTVTFTVGVETADSTGGTD